MITSKQVEKRKVVNIQSMLILSRVTAEFSSSFEGLGCLQKIVKTKVSPEAKPVVHPPRKVPVMLKQKVEDVLRRMEKMGVIVS